MDATTNPTKNPTEVGCAAAWAHATGTVWLTSDEFAPAVLVWDRKDECSDCGTYTGGGTCSVNHS